MGNMIFEPCAGLGNRLKGVASFIKLYKKHGREGLPVIVWKRETACCAKFSDLFSLNENFVVREITDMPKKYISYLPQTVLGRARRQRFVSGVSFLDNGFTMYLAKNHPEVLEHLFDTRDGCYLKGTGFLTECDAADFNWVKPSDRVSREGDKIFRRIEEHTTGVHIRRTDHKDAIKNSPTELFRKKMNEIIRREPESSFYVATDDRGELEALRKEYRDRIISIDDPDYSRDKAAGQIFSAIDMFALSKCRIILGSSGSTFSEAASLIGKKQLEIVTNEN